jgi:methionine sulfoxide reductase heme-binding subunit
MQSHTWWYTARAGGIVAWALLSITVIGGLQLSTRLARRPTPAWVLDVHRFVAGLAVALVGVHLLGLALDPFVKFGVAQLFVPFLSSYRSGDVALGIVALYLLVAIELTSLAMRRLSRQLWHAVHLSSYPLFALVTVHGLTAGTDRRNAIFQWACLLAASLVLFMTLVRIIAPRRATGARRSAVK